MRLEVLYEDNHLLAINKRAGIATMGAEAGRDSIVDLVRDYLRRKYAKPGNVYIGVVSRLDQTVSGVLLLARTSKAASRLTEQFRSRSVEKSYWAVVEGGPPASAELVDDVIKDEARHRMRIADPGDAQAQAARLSFRRLAAVRGGVWLEVGLETGRKHQIRLQLSSRGWPVLGDRKYGARTTFGEGIALHARRLSFTHPTRGEIVEIVAQVPATWRGLGIADVGQ